MREAITATALAAALTVVPVSAVWATTPPADPNDVEAIGPPRWTRTTTTDSTTGAFWACSASVA